VDVPPAKFAVDAEYAEKEEGEINCDINGFDISDHTNVLGVYQWQMTQQMY
jgi:hypothetical protein